MSDSIIKNIKSSRNISIAAYLLGAVCFLIAYLMSDQVWFLIASIILFVTSFLFIFLFRWIENKLLKKKGNNNGQ